MNTNAHGAVAADEATHDEFGGRIYSLRHIAAFGAYTAAGWSLQDLSAAHLEALLEDKHFAGEVRAERQRRATAAAPTPTPSRPAAAPMTAAAKKMPAARLPRLSDADDLRSEEGFEKWVDENAAAAVPILFWARAVKASREKREDLEARVTRLESMLLLADNEIKILRTLQTNTAARGISWAGEWAHGHGYQVGEVVKHKGSTWIAIADTTSAPGSSPNEWELVMKSQAYAS